jgi:hypothetical protein
VAVIFQLLFGIGIIQDNYCAGSLLTTHLILAVQHQRPLSTPIEVLHPRHVIGHTPKIDPCVWCVWCDETRMVCMVCTVCGVYGVYRVYECMVFMSVWYL